MQKSMLRDNNHALTTKDTKDELKLEDLSISRRKLHKSLYILSKSLVTTVYIK